MIYAMVAVNLLMLRIKPVRFLKRVSLVPPVITVSLTVSASVFAIVKNKWNWPVSAMNNMWAQSPPHDNASARQIAKLLLDTAYCRPCAFVILFKNGV